MDTRGFAAKPGWFRVWQPGGPIGILPPEPPPQGSDVDTWLEYMAAILYYSAQVQTSIMSALARQVQRGYVYGDSVALDPTLPVFTQLFDPPLFSLSLINDGPAIVQYRIPDRSDAVWVPIRPNENVIFNFIEGLVNSCGMRLQPGGLTAIVRVEGTY